MKATRQIGLPAVLLTAFLIEGGNGRVRGRIFDVADLNLPTELRIANDLKLRVKSGPRKVVQAGSSISAELVLVNESRKTTYHVVKPGDGSDVGWREPHVYLTATIDRGDGISVPVPEVNPGRCGNFDWKWPTDVTTLMPGAELPIQVEGYLELQQPGRVKLVAHYDYLAGQGPRSRSRYAPDQLGEMAGVPTFRLTSDPIEFEMVRPLDVRVRVKRSLKVGEKARLSDFLDVRLLNTSRGPIECSSPTLSADARLMVLAGGVDLYKQPELTEHKTSYGIQKTLPPGEEISLLGNGEFANGVDGTWECPKAGVYVVRAGYTPSTWKSGPTILSEYVEIKVE